MLRLIAALDSKRGIATDTGIPWDLPSDRKFFHDQLDEGLILMGAGTYAECATPMRGRLNYVLTHTQEPLRAGFEAVHDIDAFVAAHQQELINDVGGAGVYTLTLQYADELILTRVDGDFACSKFFPEFERTFQCVDRSVQHQEHGITFHYERWVRSTD